MDQDQNQLKELRHAERPARKAVISIWVFIAAGPFSLLADAVNYFQRASSVSILGIDEDVQNNIALVIFALFLLLFLTSAGFVLHWIYRVNQNARALAADKTIGPGWAVGWYFIPVAHFWKPFQAMRETWQIATDPTNWRSVAVPGLLRMWWAFWIIGGLLDHTGGLFMSAHSTELLMTADAVTFASRVVTIVSALLLIRIIKEVTRRQLVVITSASVFD